MRDGGVIPAFDPAGGEKAAAFPLEAVCCTVRCTVSSLSGNACLQLGQVAFFTPSGMTLLGTVREKAQWGQVMVNFSGMDPP